MSNIQGDSKLKPTFVSPPVRVDSTRFDNLKGMVIVSLHRHACFAGNAAEHYPSAGLKLLHTQGSSIYKMDMDSLLPDTSTCSCV